MDISLHVQALNPKSYTHSPHSIDRACFGISRCVISLIISISSLPIKIPVTQYKGRRWKDDRCVMSQSRTGSPSFHRNYSPAYELMMIKATSAICIHNTWAIHINFQVSNKYWCMHAVFITLIKIVIEGSGQHDNDLLQYVNTCRYMCLFYYTCISAGILSI